MTKQSVDRAAGARSRVKVGPVRKFHEKFLVEERVVAASVKKRLYITAAILIIVGGTFFVLILTDVFQRDDLTTIDAPIESWLRGLRTEWLTALMIVFAIVFGPIMLPIVILIVTVTWGVVAKHAWRPLLLAAGTATGVVVVQLLAPVVERRRPPIDYMLFGPDTTFSFPSGHVMGASNFLLLLAYLVLSRKRNPRATIAGFAVAALLIIAAGVCRVYLGYHWTTDALASLSLSLIILGTVITLDVSRTMRVQSDAGSGGTAGSRGSAGSAGQSPVLPTTGNAGQPVLPATNTARQPTGVIE